MQTDLKSRIREHYDRASDLYRDVWGTHIHHGCWIDGRETRARAQDQLVELIAERAAVRRGEHVLDVGCGIGGTAVLLAEQCGARVTGITLSVVQATMARSLAAARDVGDGVHFSAMDAERMAVQGAFDVIWAVESLSHMAAKGAVIADLAEQLVPSGRFAVADWFRSEHVDASNQRRRLQPVVDSMLLPELNPISHYVAFLEQSGCQVTVVEDLSDSVARTWDVCIELIRPRTLWRAARRLGPDFVRFLNGVRAMRNAFESGAFRYGLIVAERR